MQQQPLYLSEFGTYEVEFGISPDMCRFLREHLKLQPTKCMFSLSVKALRVRSNAWSTRILIRSLDLFSERSPSILARLVGYISSSWSLVTARKSRSTIRGFHDLHSIWTCLRPRQYLQSAVACIQLPQGHRSTRRTQGMEKQLHLVLGHWRPPSAHRGKHLGSIHRCMFADGFRQHMSMILRKAVKKKQFTRCRRVCSTQQFQTLCIQHLQSSEKNNSPHPLESLCSRFSRCRLFF